VGTRPWRFDAKWLKERGFAKVVQRAWERASPANPGEGVMSLLAHLHSTLHAWDWWRGVDDVNDRPVGNPKRRCDEHNNKFSLSYETKVYQSSRKKPNV
jgi:hypothetical protein